MSNRLYKLQYNRVVAEGRGFSWVAFFVLTVWLLSAVTTHALAESIPGLLTLQDAERIAINNDPLIARTKAVEESFRDKAIAANRWPDPKLTLGIANLSMETYDFEDEAMTQMIVGISQRFPGWGELKAKSGRLSELAGATAAELKDRELRTRLAVRKAWLDMHYQYQAEQLVKQSTEVFDQLKEITRLQYRAGRGSQRDVINAQLEKSLLRDRQTMIHTQWLTAKAQLTKWLGASNRVEELNTGFPDLPPPPSNQQLRGLVEQHPWLRAAQNRVTAAEKGVDYAKAQTWPEWSINLQYGQRGAERADLGSAIINVDLPLFTGNRQDREISASQAELNATQRTVDDQRRQLREQVDVQWSVYDQAGQRLSLYESNVLPEAKQNTETSLSAYQAGVIEFGILVRARLTELNSELQYLKLKIDKAKAQVELLYLSGS
ncbi:MAG: TolC family protein [Gammaproteobacteria bacterium]|jgi:outer membrane protein TolC